MLDVAAALREDHEPELVEAGLGDRIDGRREQRLVLVQPVVGGRSDRAERRAVGVREVEAVGDADRPVLGAARDLEARPSGRRARHPRSRSSTTTPPRGPVRSAPVGRAAVPETGHDPSAPDASCREPQRERCAVGGDEVGALEGQLDRPVEARRTGEREAQRTRGFSFDVVSVGGGAKSGVSRRELSRTISSGAKTRCAAVPSRCAAPCRQMRRSRARSPRRGGRRRRRRSLRGARGRS